jgi:hypothetical protein
MRGARCHGLASPPGLSTLSWAGDTGYYRHRDPCRSFTEAKPDLPPRPGRTHGKAYPREMYEAVVGEVLSEVKLNAKLLTTVVGAVAPSQQRPDRVALARVAHQRDAATTKYIQDRDVATLEATMARLDAEEQEARQERVVDGVPPAEAVRYLRELQPTWEAADGGPGRKMLAEALFERIDVRGFQEVEIHLTDAAIAHGFGAVLPESFGISVSGRGERGSASLAHLPARPRFVLVNRTRTMPRPRLAVARRA